LGFDKAIEITKVLSILKGGVNGILRLFHPLIEDRTMIGNLILELGIIEVDPVCETGGRWILVGLL
jgi:hypothetical protein